MNNQHHYQDQYIAQQNESHGFQPQNYAPQVQNISAPCIQYVPLLQSRQIFGGEYPYVAMHNDQAPPSLQGNSSFPTQTLLAQQAEPANTIVYQPIIYVTQGVNEIQVPIQSSQELPQSLPTLNLCHKATNLPSNGALPNGQKLTEINIKANDQQRYNGNSSDPLSKDQLGSQTEESETKPVFNFNYMGKCQDRLKRIQLNQIKNGVDNQSKTLTSLLPVPEKIQSSCNISKQDLVTQTSHQGAKNSQQAVSGPLNNTKCSSKSLNLDSIQGSQKLDYYSKKQNTGTQDSSQNMSSEQPQLDVFTLNWVLKYLNKQKEPNQLNTSSQEINDFQLPRETQTSNDQSRSDKSNSLKQNSLQIKKESQSKAIVIDKGDYIMVKKCNKDTNRMNQVLHCKKCKLKFPKLCNMKDHLRIHSKEEPFRCKFCSKCFSQSGNRDRHEKKLICIKSAIEDIDKTANLITTTARLSAPFNNPNISNFN